MVFLPAAIACSRVALNNSNFIILSCLTHPFYVDSLLFECLNAIIVGTTNFGPIIINITFAHLNSLAGAKAEIAIQ